jgi:hypothetical protein
MTAVKSTSVAFSVGVKTRQFRHPCISMKFYCVNDNVPDETIDFLTQGCLLRNIEFQEINAKFFDFTSIPCEIGDILFRPAISSAAIEVEQFIYHEGVATFYSDPEGPLFPCTNPSLMHIRAGLPVPRY